ncbi:hypothetical protein AB0E63_36885 [Kribbella sp. NPDC026596]|uniref:hypothetical protein n=1 Tax=Kribbella sp. NPDC026596 TaxID=3155122 RepID=UPI0033D27CDB
MESRKTADAQQPEDRWDQLRPSAVLAIRELAASLESGGRARDVLDLYVYSKRIVAEVMEARLEMEFPEPCVEFHQIRDELAVAMADQYGDVVPRPYLTVPYGSRVHEKLFQILLQRFDTEVPAGLLRIPTRDSVHSERRLRELRELGLDISPSKSSGVDTYRLRSLRLDFSLIPRIVYNNAQKKKHALMPKAKLKKALGTS